MSEFQSIYFLGYGDAVADERRNRKRTWPKTAFLVLIAALLAFWAGRASREAEVSSAYESGFDAGVAEGTTIWEEWK